MTRSMHQVVSSLEEVLGGEAFRRGETRADKTGRGAGRAEYLSLATCLWRQGMTHGADSFCGVSY
jgi:hypothetical protein